MLSPVVAEGCAVYVLADEGGMKGDRNLANLLEPTQYYLKFPR